LPGGARLSGETALAAALREAGQEIGLTPDSVEPRWWVIADHHGWAYTTIGVEAVNDSVVGQLNWETERLEWVELDQVVSYKLHPGLRQIWPELVKLVGRRAVLVVDGANVVGSRPDGWWRDRAGAARRLRDQLEVLPGRQPSGEEGLGDGIGRQEPNPPDGTRRRNPPLTNAGLANLAGGQPAGWYPEVVLIVEGKARGIGQGANVRVIDAPGEGDDQIVAETRRLVALNRGPVDVVTADKGLIRRLHQAGAGIMRPGALLARLTE
jgi:hypothetical protein